MGTVRRKQEVCRIDGKISKAFLTMLNVIVERGVLFGVSDEQGHVLW